MFTPSVFSQLCTQIEQLEKENKGLKEGGGASAAVLQPSPASSPVDGELLRLQAENAALQKKLKGVCVTGSEIRSDQNNKHDESFKKHVINMPNLFLIQFP